MIITRSIQIKDSRKVERVSDGNSTVHAVQSSKHSWSSAQVRYVGH